jgi:DNA-binding transcriptional ArsR family regulator
VETYQRVLPVSRPAGSQHLRVLKAAGLVVDRPQGSRRLSGVDPRGLEALRVYLEGLWGEALASYRRAADGPSRQPTREGEG